jgi:hypothetical protein
LKIDEKQFDLTTERLSEDPDTGTRGHGETGTFIETTTIFIYFIASRYPSEAISWFEIAAS